MKFKTISVLIGLAGWGVAVESHSLQPIAQASVSASAPAAATTTMSAVSDETILPTNIFVNLAKKAVPSVVNISTVSTLKRTAFLSRLSLTR